MSDDVKQSVSKLLGKKKFTITARETVYYSVEIETYSEDEAWELTHSGNVDFPMTSVVDGSDFEIMDIEEVEDAPLYDTRPVG